MKKENRRRIFKRETKYKEGRVCRRCGAVLRTSNPNKYCDPCQTRLNIEALTA